MEKLEDIMKMTGISDKKKEKMLRKQSTLILQLDSKRC